MNATERSFFALADKLQRDNPGLDRVEAICAAEKACRGARPRPLTMRDVAQDNARKLIARADQLQRHNPRLSREDALVEAGHETGKVTLRAVDASSAAGPTPGETLGHRMIRLVESGMRPSVAQERAAKEFGWRGPVDFHAMRNVTYVPGAGTR